MLLIFVVFLSTPTIVGLIEKSCDTSIFYSMSEEEHAHQKVIKAEVKSDICFTIAEIPQNTSSLILSENLSKHDNVSSSIFIPPPEQV